MSSTTGGEAIWQRMAERDRRRLTDLFQSDPKRVEGLVFECAGLYFDFSKTHLDDALLQDFGVLAEATGLADKIAALLSGQVVNPSEDRAAEHSAERGVGDVQAVAQAKALRQRMQTLVSAVEAEAFGPVDHVIHLGIGGSALGPKLLIEALAEPGEGPDVAVVSNIDGAALEPVLDAFDPQKTLVVIASKSFTTAETFLNAESVIDWMAEGGVADPQGRIVALTAKPEKASEWGVDDSRILPFSETVGGRYSLWSSIGFSVALKIGFGRFEQLLAGAQAMDEHFRDAPLAENIPVLAAFADQYYAQIRDYETQALFAYDERLALLPDYLQQLIMESNGKSVRADGSPLGRNSSAILWGGVGTDAQHAVFQLLHQGTRVALVEFIAVVEPGHGLAPEHHEGLLLNCFAQGAALMAGRSSDDGNRNYPGDRPSTTILLDRLDPATLGALIAFYEHRTFANAALLGINPFDQFGVELGKQMAHQLAGAGEGNPLDPSTEQLRERAFGKSD